MEPTFERRTVGDELYTLLDDQIAAERTLKTSLEARGLAVITSSGTIVTLIFALAALVTKSTRYNPSIATRALLVISATAFVLAAGLGIYCNKPKRYFEIEPASLEILTHEGNWRDAGDEARREIAQARLEVLQDARDKNGKAVALQAATLAELLAVVLTASAAAVILI